MIGLIRYTAPQSFKAFDGSRYKLVISRGSENKNRTYRRHRKRQSQGRCQPGYINFIHRIIKTIPIPVRGAVLISQRISRPPARPVIGVDRALLPQQSGHKRRPELRKNRWEQWGPSWAERL